eukprot:6193325-Pleurochrysis_carterae.AAC.1
MRACLAMCIGWLVQQRKASTVKIVWVNRTIYQRTSQDAHDPAHGQRGCVRLHIVQQIGDDQLAQLQMANPGGYDISMVVPFEPPPRSEIPGATHTMQWPFEQLKLQ